MSGLSINTSLGRIPSRSIRRTKLRPFQDWNDLAWKLIIVLFSAAVLWLTFQYKPHKYVYHILWYSWPGRILLTTGSVYGIVATVWTFWRLLLAVRYRPYPIVQDARLPKITVVVPAYNEGPLVARTLHNLALADYPEDRIEIIVVDDGSDDDTWHYIQTAAREIGPRIMALHFDENRGKRWALWEGFRRGTGKVFVTVDSDSLVARDALKAVVSPMVQDSKIGAVAGNVRVLNKSDGLIPRMLDVRYVMTFDYKRAAQSMMGGTVLCCAGALAAYRRKAVMPVLDAWLHQTFRGGPARAGEDHAMTNFIISQGYKACYQRAAHVVTKSPSTLSGLCKMFLRWARSNIRESVHTAKYVFTNFREGPKTGIRFNYVMCALGLFLPYPYLMSALVLSLFMPTLFGLKMLASCVSASLFTMVFFAVRERSLQAIYGVAYTFSSTLVFWWIWPYALLTCDRSVWMTRKAKQVKSSPKETAPVTLALPMREPVTMPEVVTTPNLMPHFVGVS